MQNAGLNETQAGIQVSGTWRRKWQPTPVFLPGKVHGQRSLAGCSPWGYLRHADDTTLMAESEEELKSLLMKVKEESEKADLKLNI